MIKGTFRGLAEEYDEDAADASGSVTAERSSFGRPIEVPDAQIAAICILRGAVLATRNTEDFDGLGIT